MQSVSQATLDKINQSTAYSMSGGCWLEYNMNDLIDGTTITSPVETATIIDPVTKKSYQPFKKLFPLKNIIDPRRPSFAGINYFILNPNVITQIPKYNVSTDLPIRTYFSSAKTQYKFWLSPQASGNSLSNCNFTVEYPVAKTAVTNTVIVKFETSYSKPANWSIKIQDHAGVESTVSTNGVVPANGVFQLYYNGSSWSTTRFTTPSAPVNIKKIIVTVNTIDIANSFLGVIEVGARYIQDVSNRIVSFQVSKNSSDDSSGIVPVGSVTSNALSLALEGFDRKGIEYDKTSAFNKSNINLYKNVKVMPFNKIGDDVIPQGVFYIDSFTISEFGDIDIQGLDGAKFLQEILAPDIVIQNAPSQAIVRRLLDSVGFTSYNFNTYGKADPNKPDTATIVPLYWYTEDTKTVWQHIQDLCKDTQMIATFDNNDILQFYPRDYLFDKTRPTSFKFRSATKGSNAPNIVSLTKETVPSVKAVKVIYTPIISTNYSGSSDNLYVSPPAALGAAALQSTLLASAPAETDAPLGVVRLAPISVYSDLADTSFYNKAGYFLINNEIVEYDAMEFQYEPLSGSGTVKKWITSDSDIAKYLGESKINSFKPTLKFRIKQRNAFNATGKGIGTGEEHSVDVDKLKGEWKGSKLNITAKTNVDDQSVFSLKQTDGSGNSISRSLLTIIAPPASKEYYCASVSSGLDFADKTYFSIGTALFFKLARDSNNRVTGEQPVSAGLGIGLSSNNLNGYLLKIGTSQNVANKGLNSRDVQLFKLVNGVETVISDTQKTEDNSITGVSGGEFYRIDVKVSKATAGKLIFKIKFNNQIITATDSAPITLSNKIALIGIQGESAFDYAYSSTLTKEEFAGSSSYDNYGSYVGAATSLKNVFGEFLAGGTESTATAPSWVKEFGPVAREIKKISTKYATRPGFVKYPQIILNPNATLLGYDATSFGIDAYILNNTGAFIDLADGGQKSFIVVGETIAPLDPFEYIDPDLSSTKNEEQVAFESTWIQKESEAKALSEWMRTQWSKQQTVLSLEVFPNPILETGDVVEISYPSNLVYSSEDTGFTAGKYIILDIEQGYSDSPATTIVCRSIYV